MEIICFNILSSKCKVSLNKYRVDVWDVSKYRCSTNCKKSNQSAKISSQSGLSINLDDLPILICLIFEVFYNSA